MHKDVTDYGHFSDSNATKRSQIQPFEEDPLRNGKFVETNERQPNQSRETFTMGELILNKRGSQMQTGVLKHSLAHSNSITRNISSGAKIKLFLVDKDDDDEEYAVSSHDMNQAYGEKDGCKDDQLEDI